MSVESPEGVRVPRTTTAASSLNADLQRFVARYRTASRPIRLDPRARRRRRRSGLDPRRACHLGHIWMPFARGRSGWHGRGGRGWCPSGLPSTAERPRPLTPAAPGGGPYRARLTCRSMGVHEGFVKLSCATFAVCYGAGCLPSTVIALSGGDAESKGWCPDDRHNHAEVPCAARAVPV